MWVPGHDASRPALRPPAASTPSVNISAVSPPHESKPSQLKDNFIAALAYVTFIPALVFVLIPPFKSNCFVRFHSFQSILLTVATILVGLALRILFSVLALIPVLGYLLAWLAMAVVLLGWVILWLVLLVKALQGETFRLPVIGSLAEKI